MSMSARLDGISLWKRQCVACDGAAPSCDCDEGEKCVLTGRTCQQCPTIQCIPNGSGSSGKGVNPGVIAGPVVAVLLIASLAALWWLRRKRRRALERLEELAQRARKAESKSFHLSQPGSPNPGSARSAQSGSYRGSANGNNQDPSAAPLSAGMRSSQRSPLPPVPVNAEYYDENGASIKVYKGNIGTIDLRHDPFSDRQSVSTNGNGGPQSMHIIPIQYIPPGPGDHGDVNHKSAATGKRPVSNAARTLDEARKNLFRPGQAPPRPARSPDLDLRLNPPPNAIGDVHLKSPVLSKDYRDSYLSGNSGAPSFLSSSTDLLYDAPQIVTSKQVHIGRVQQAEVVQMGHGKLSSSPDGIRDEDPFEAYRSPTSHDLPPPSSPGTFGARHSGVGSKVSGAASGTASYRTLTPTSRRQAEGGGDEDNDEQDMRGEDPSTTELRFSMGSLAYRDSISTMNTGRYLAQAQIHTVDGVGMAMPPRIGLGAGLGSSQPLGNEAGARESISSARSGTDYLLGLGNFPMIPPNQIPSSLSGLPSLPQSTSVSTIDNAALLSRPPPSYRPPPPSASSRALAKNQSHLRQSHVDQSREGHGRNVRDTTHSVADSFLGTFPFVPPSDVDLDTLPTIGSSRGVGGVASSNPTSPNSPLPTSTQTRSPSGNPNSSGNDKTGVYVGRGTQGMSTTSEALGLGGFEFSFANAAGDVPPLP